MRSENEPTILEARASTGLGRYLTSWRNRWSTAWIHSFAVFCDPGNLAGVCNVVVAPSVILAVALVWLYHNGDNILWSATSQEFELEHDRPCASAGQFKSKCFEILPHRRRPAQDLTQTFWLADRARPWHRNLFRFRGSLAWIWPLVSKNCSFTFFVETDWSDHLVTLSDHLVIL